MFNKVTKRDTNSSNEILKILQSAPASEIHKFSAEMTAEVIRNLKEFDYFVTYLKISERCLTSH